MKKIFYIICFLSFANVLLGQVGLRVDDTQFATENKLDWKKKSEQVKVFFTKKNQLQLPVDLKKHLLSKNVNTNSNNIFTQKKTAQEVAFFCRIEDKIEQVQAVDRKEGKWQQFQ